MVIGNKTFETNNHTYVMGILNVTPDSFSDGGKYNDMSKALKRVETMIEEGVHIIDVGGESTRPGYEIVPDEEEIERTAPVIEKIKASFDIPVSIDTYKPAVFKAALEAGVDMLNDISCLKEHSLADMLASSKVAYCLMHNRSEDRYNPEKGIDYNNLIDDINADMKQAVDVCIKAGVSKDKIVLDPGVGFAKSYENNIEVLKKLSGCGFDGYPMLLGASRKSVVGLTLDLPKDQRLEGTLATTALAVMADYAFVRVHDVLENVRIIKMLEAVKYYK